MLKRVLFAAPLLLLELIPATADQCKLVSRSIAEQAVILLPKGTVIQEFCAPCDDMSAQRTVVSSANVAWSGQLGHNYFTVKVNNDDDIDLAYTYVLAGTGKKQWINIGRMLECGAEDVPRILPDQYISRSDDKPLGQVTAPSNPGPLYYQKDQSQFKAPEQRDDIDRQNWQRQKPHEEETQKQTPEQKRLEEKLVHPPALRGTRVGPRKGLGQPATPAFDTDYQGGRGFPKWLK